MAKKNSKPGKNIKHEFDLQREKEAAELAAAKREKKKRNRESRELKGGVAKVKKEKGFRIRKGVTIKGIKVVDGETKTKVRKLIAKAKAAKTKMEVDVDAPRAKRVKRAGGSAAVKGKDMMDVQ